MHNVPCKIPELQCPIHSFTFYEKARFVLYSMEIKCTSLRYSNNYSCLLNDLASAHCLMISSASEVQHLSVSRCLFLTAPNNITHLLDNLQFWYSSHQFFYILITHISTVLQSPGVCPHTFT